MLDLVVFAISRAMGINPHAPMTSGQHDEFTRRFELVTRTLRIGVYEYL